jgi:hypothetical protein
MVYVGGRQAPLFLITLADPWDGNPSSYICRRFQVLPAFVTVSSARSLAALRVIQPM